MRSPKIGVLGTEKMANRLALALDSIAREEEAPIYALERLRFALAEDQAVAACDVKRLVALDKSGEGRAFGPGWCDFLAFAKTAQKHKK
jgi:hypothetical protein